MTLGLRFHHGGYTTQGGWPRKRGELRKPRTPESMLASTKGGAGSHTQTSQLCTGGGPAGKRLFWCGLGYCSVRGFLLFGVLCFRSCCSLSNPNKQRQEAWAVERHYLETGSSKNPTAWLAGHSNFSLVETGMVWGKDLGRKPPVEESVLLPTQERLAWEPDVSWGLSIINAWVVGMQGTFTSAQSSISQKWVLQEPILLDLNTCCMEVTYQSQMYLRNAHTQVYSF